MTTTSNGLVLGAMGVAVLCAMDAVAKAMGAEYSTFQIVFMRYVGAALWLGLWALATGGSWPRIANVGRQTLRATLLVATASMFFYAVARLPLALVTALAMTAPLYVSIIGVLFLKEQTGPTAWFALALGAVGSVIILFEGGALDLSNTEGELLAWGAAIIAPASYAATLSVLKYHSALEDSASMTLGQSLIAALLTLPFALGAPIEITPQLAGWFTAIGLLGAAGFLLLLEGLRQIPVSAFAVIDYTGIVWAALLGLVFFGEVPSLRLFLGALLIVSACSALAFTQRAAQQRLV